MDLGGLDRLDRGDTALETALGDGVEVEVTNEPFEVGKNGGLENPGGTFTLPQVGNAAKPGAGETRLENDSGFLMRFCADFPSDNFTESRFREIGGFETGGCGLGTLRSDLVEPSFNSIARLLGAFLLDRDPLGDAPVSVAFFSLLKQGSHTLKGLPGFGANDALRDFLELHA